MPTESLIFICQKVSDVLAQDVEQNKDQSFQNHFLESQNAICRAIEKLDGMALIFGAGGAFDLPLVALAHQFTSIVLIDIDIRHTETALENIPSEFQEKFQIQQADLTGILSELSIEAEKIVGKDLSYEEFISSIIDLLPNLKAREFDCSSLQPNFVCSSLVDSQLNTNILLYFENLSQCYYQRSFDTGARNAEFCEWLEQVQINHLNYLNFGFFSLKVKDIAT